MDIKTQYDAIAGEYIQGQKDYFANRPDEARNFIKKEIGDFHGLTLLDIGCGGGTDVVTYEQMGAAAVYGIDPSRSMVEAAKSTVQQPEFVTVQDAERTNFLDDMFDVVVARFSLHYLERFDTAYAEVPRILKPHGRFIFVVQHPLRDLRDKKEKIYGKQEIVTITMYDQKIPLTFPTHALSDYLSPAFFQFFELRAIDENNLTNGKEIPAMLGISAVKR